MQIAGVVLAAGAGRRYGMAKALVERDGRLLVRRAAGTLAEAGCTPVLVVVGARAGDVRAAAPELTYVDNPDWAGGMASSLRAGLAALAGTPAAAAVAAPDALATGGYAGRRGHPVLLGRDHWAGVAASATGDRGARDYLRAHAGRVQVVGVADVADDADLDVPSGAGHA